MVDLLRAACPDEIPVSDRIVVLEVLRDTGMSDRSVAAALGSYLGDSNENLLHEVTVSLRTAAEHAKARVVEHLRKFGYDPWVDEP